MSKSKTKDTYTYTISMDTYEATIKVLYSPVKSTTEIFNIVAAKENYPNDGKPGNECGDGALTFFTSSKRIIYLIFGKDPKIHYLHHECIHATEVLFNFIQTEHNDDTSEVFCYLSHTLFRSIYKILLNKFKVPAKKFLAP